MKKLIAALSLVFLVSFFYRAPYLGRLTGGHWQWINAQPMVFSHNWLRDGALNSNFAMTYEGSGIESPSVSERTPYVSYSPLFLLPLHMLSLLLQKPIEIHHVQILSILLHLITALLLGFLSYRLVEKRSPKGALWAFAGASILWMLHPIPLYYQSLIYFTDLAILPLFALFLVLESYDLKKNKKILWAQRGLCLLIALSDWFSVSIAIALTLSRILDVKKSKGKTQAALGAMIPFICGWALHILHLGWMGRLGNLHHRFMERTGLSSTEWPPLSDLLHKFFVINIGIVESLLLFIALIFFIYSKKKKLTRYQLPTNFLILLFLPPFLHTLLLMEHSYIHAFSTAKFYFPVAVAISAMGTFLAVDKYNKKWEGAGLLTLSIIAIYCLYVENIFFNGRAAIRTSPKLEVAKWVGEIHKKNEVVLSNTLSITWNPPTQLALSGTHVWSFSSYEKLKEWKAHFLSSAPHSLLWIEHKQEDRKDCLELFRKTGKTIDSLGEFEAIRFENSETFLNLPEVKSSHCLSSVN